MQLHIFGSFNFSFEVNRLHVLRLILLVITYIETPGTALGNDPLRQTRSRKGQFYYRNEAGARSITFYLAEAYDPNQVYSVESYHD